MKIDKNMVASRRKVLLLISSLMFFAFACNGTPVLKQDAIVEIKAHKYSAEIADTPQAREDGLSGIASISDTEGMLFLFSEPQILKFWMRGMQFPIDIIWIDGDTIVDITENVAVPSPATGDFDLGIYQPSKPSDKAFEVNSGWSLRHDIKIGDKVSITRK